MSEITYQFEYENRIRAAFIGAGGHSFRNVYPALQYAPIDLVAVADPQLDRAQAYARQFGATAAYADHREMLSAEKPEAVFIVTGYDADGSVQATAIARDALEAGAHVWMEKPTAATSAEIVELMAVSERTGRLVMTGLKKIFTPAMQKVKQIITSPEFGPVSSISIRYPQSLPAPEERADRNAMRQFLDHIYHPGAVLSYLGGPIERMSYEWEPVNGATVTSLRFASGVIGQLHLVAGSPINAPFERTEVVGRGGSVIVENGVRIVYYRGGAAPTYGRESSYIVDDEVAPLFWEPEFSLGQLYNKNLFYLGYVPEVLHFCAAVRGEAPLTLGTLEQSAQIMALYDTFQRLPSGVAGPVVAHGSGPDHREEQE
jgi:predicted dehydrogenase